MPTVPKDDRVVPFRPQPSETDLMMALATMKDLGRIPTGAKIDPVPLSAKLAPAEGQVEDRRSDFPGTRRNWGPQIFGKPEPFKEVPWTGLADQLGFKDIPSRANMGVSGGSR